MSATTCAKRWRATTAAPGRAPTRTWSSASGRGGAARTIWGSQRRRPRSTSAPQAAQRARLLGAGVLRSRLCRQHARHAFTARVARPLVAAVGEPHHAVQSGVFRMAGFQLDAALAQPGEQRGRELAYLTAEGVAACDEVWQLDSPFEGQFPGEQSHQCLGVVLENRRAAGRAERGDEVAEA